MKKQNNKSKLSKEERELIDENILFKIKKEIIISGGGKILLWLVYVYGGWRKYFKMLKKRSGYKKELEYIQRFKEQEKKYGIKIKITNPKEDFDKLNFIGIRR